MSLSSSIEVHKETPMSNEILRLKNLQKYYGAKLILDEIKLNVNRLDRAVLVGENGVGKSTLARIILGQERIEKGDIKFAPNTQIGYLPQEVTVSDDVTVREYIEQTIGDLNSIRDRLRDLEKQMSDTDDLDAVLAEYGQLQETFEQRGGYTLDSRLEQIFDGLDLRHIDQERQMVSLSGGEKTRIGLAALLLQAPDLLILDEPTNHLDFVGLTWLEDYLLTYPNALLMITHDRHFINKVATQIIDLSAVTHSLTVYHGNYDEYVAERERQYQQEVEAYHGQVNQMKRLQQLMKKEQHGHRKAKKLTDGDKAIKFAREQQVARTVSKAVKSVRTQLDVLEANKLDNPRHVWTIKFEFTPEPLISTEPIHLEDLTMCYGERVLFRDTSVILNKGERVAIVAPNGTGKTTLLRLIMRQLKPTSGQIKVMSSAKLGYLDQEGETFNPDQNVVDVLREIHADSDDALLTRLHRSGLFRDAHLSSKTVADLSLGQQRKLGLACLIHSQANVLLLDEPTNHLDLMSLEALEKSLLDFDGAILAATHDRWFIDNVATQIWRLDKGRLIVESR
jgi:macrolide transport system ATP-binding/permease protein